MASPVTYASRVADFVASLDWDSLPPDVIRQTKRCILDTIAVSILGSRTREGEIIAGLVLRQGGVPESTIMANRQKMPAESAALVNGTFAHSMDFDDDLGACHVGSAVIPAALAVSELTGANGKEFVTSVLAGYEVTSKVSNTVDPGVLYGRGFHPTGVCDVFGATTAASRLLGLDRKQTTNALGIAGSFASGLMEFLSDGAMTKRIHPGKAARDGILAARLAQEGLTGPASVFEGRDGFLHAYSDGGPPRPLILEDDRFDILSTTIKYYPCCDSSHCAMEATRELVQENDIIPLEVDSITVGLRKISLNIVGVPPAKKQSVQTILDAQMSLPFCVAGAILYDAPFLGIFSEQGLRDERIRELAARVEAVHEAAYDDLPLNPFHQPARVKVKTRDGRVFEKTIELYKGDPQRPLSDDDMMAKFRACTKGVLGPAVADEIRRSVDQLENSKDTLALANLLAGGRP